MGYACCPAKNTTRETHFKPKKNPPRKPPNGSTHTNPIAQQLSGNAGISLQNPNYPFSLSLSFFSLSFPAGKIPPASPWNCPDMLLCGGRGRKSGMSEGSWEQKVFFCFAGSGSLSCKPAVLCACPGLLLPSLLMGSCTHSCFHAATNCLIQALVQLQRSSGPLCAVS